MTVFPILPEQKLISEDIIHDEFSEEVRSHYDMIACCGGDGTLHHVVESLVHEKLHIPLMYYPAGTTNDFAKSLKIPDTVEKSVRLYIMEAFFTMTSAALTVNALTTLQPLVLLRRSATRQTRASKTPLATQHMS